MRDRNPVDPDGRGGVEQLGQVGKGETNQDMGYEKDLFNKRNQMQDRKQKSWSYTI